MKGILLAGGRGTRLYPITKVINKHLLPVYDKPMIYFGLKTLVDSGIREVAVVQGPPFGDQVKIVVEELKFKIRVVYVYQPKSMGMPDAILRCQRFTDGESIIVVAGDNLFGKDFKKEVSEFKNGAVGFLRQVRDPGRFGAPVYNKKGELVAIKEKPKNPQTNWVVTGPHIFDNQVFDLIKTLRPSARGELEISELNNLYLKQGQLKLVKRRGFWTDVGTPNSLLKASNFIYKMRG